ncbi:MAG: TIGR02285 family protein [Hahellaceae bacterium]|nr:TIGR02285 family protein [Hahellaceae bacterium]
MRSIVLFLISKIVLIAALLLSGSTVANQRVTWLEVDIPPFFIYEGEYANQGIVDRIMALIEARLTSYDYHHQQVSFKRATAFFDAPGTYCHASYFKTPEREQLAYFSSVASTLSPPIGVTIRKHMKEKILTGTPLSLGHLLESDTVKGGAVQGRSYGPLIDPLLKRHAEEGKLFFRSTSDLYEGSFRMLVAGRYDYLIGYPLEAMFAAKKNKYQDIVTLPITESTDFLPGYVACSKTPEGEALIKKINVILKAERPQAHYKAIFHQWLDEFSTPQFNAAFDQWLTNESRPRPATD